MVEQSLKKAEEQMKRSLEFFEEELGGVRSGRAQASLVDSLKVDVYGSQMMVKQIATVNTPDARTIAITPWDKANMPMIEKSIREAQNLGLSPSNDGNVIRLNIPPLTEDRRRAMVKLISEKLEACNISLRNARHEVQSEVKKALKDKTISEDDYYDAEQKLNKLIDQFHKKSEGIFAAKEREMMEV